MMKVRRHRWSTGATIFTVVLALTASVMLQVASAQEKPRPPDDGCPKGETCATTTTQPSSTTTTRPTGGGSGDVGYLGCAATHDAVQGAHDVGPSRLWANYGVGWTPERDDPTLGGGSDNSPRAVFQRRYNFSDVSQWLDPNIPAWQDFDRALQNHPQTTLVWWQPCMTDDWIRNGENTSTLDGILAELRNHWSGPIVVSATSDYGQVSPVCKSLPLEARNDVRQWIAGMGLTPGPDLPQLMSSQHLNRCHPNEPGRASWGQTLDAAW